MNASVNFSGFMWCNYWWLYDNIASDLYLSMLIICLLPIINKLFYLLQILKTISCAEWIESNIVKNLLVQMAARAICCLLFMFNWEQLKHIFWIYVYMYSVLYKSFFVTLGMLLIHIYTVYVQYFLFFLISVVLIY